MFGIGIIFWLAIFGFAAWLFVNYWRSGRDVPEIIHDHWNCYFAELQFSSREFFQKVEEIIQKRDVPDVQLSRVEFSKEYSILSGKREYLRVRNGPYSFDICAAPYGAGFFVSWWMGEDMGCLMRILFAIPFLGAYLKRKALIKTYYILDMEDMFMSATHQAVTDAIDAVTTLKGIRALATEDKRLARRTRISA